MAGVVSRSPAIDRMREEVSEHPEDTTYNKPNELGRLVAAEVERAREHDGQAIAARLEPHALATRQEPQTAIDSAVDAAFLVEKARIDEFSEAVTALGRELAGRVRLR